jgi:hypothetical protein
VILLSCISTFICSSLRMGLGRYKCQLYYVQVHIMVGSAIVGASLHVFRWTQRKGKLPVFQHPRWPLFIFCYLFNMFICIYVVMFLGSNFFLNNISTFLPVVSIPLQGSGPCKYILI